MSVIEPPEAALAARISEPQAQCCVCFGSITTHTPYALPCTHWLCHDCIYVKGIRACPLCTKYFVLSDIKPMVCACAHRGLFLPVSNVFQLAISISFVLILLLPCGILTLSRIYLVIAVWMLRNAWQPKLFMKVLKPALYRAFQTYSCRWRIVEKLARLDSTAARKFSLDRAIGRLQPTGARTALGDAYMDTMNYINFVQRELPCRIRDGRDNFSKKDAAEEFKIKHGKEIANKLNIVQIFIDIGGDQPRNKQIADEMNAVYCDITQKNWNNKVNGILTTFPVVPLPESERARENEEKNNVLQQGVQVTYTTRPEAPLPEFPVVPTGEPNVSYTVDKGKTRELAS